PLMKKGGFEVFAGLLDNNTLRLMLSEAVSLIATAQANEVPVSDAEDVRGGKPARRFLSALGGPVLDAFYKAAWLQRFLCQVIDAPLSPTGGCGTYTYYARPGDFLALHRDIATCDLAVIPCLYDRPDPDGQGGMLYLYPDRLFEPLWTIDQSAEQGVVRLRLTPGQTLVLFGGIVPHAVLPTAAGQVRIIAPLCYRVYT
ncbi:MAG TPA: hypothetical protein VIH59_14630, partial [Candidatus Tectomicrobia bacterium]